MIIVALHRKPWLWLIAVSVAISAFWFAWSWRALDRARRYAEFELWTEVRGELDRYLRVQSHDPQAHLLYAEAVLKDGLVPVEEAVPSALSHLEQIPDGVAESAVARTKEGQILLVELLRPTAAEKKFRSAIALDPNHLPAWMGLWKLLDQTARSAFAEEAFWKCYELSPKEDRPLLLREWYMSQFFPAYANPSLDKAMGIVAENGVVTAESEARRFQVFLQTEPESPLGHVCWARWLQLDRDPMAGLQWLYDAADKIAGEEQDPFYLATVVGTLLERGEFADAEVLFRQWPADEAKGYEYWLTQAAILQNVEEKFDEAIVAYDKALSSWPGQVDWRTRSQRATCLATLGRTEEAERERVRVKKIEGLVQNDVQGRLRKVLEDLSNPETLREVVDFYRSIEREREAKCWEEVIESLIEQRKAGAARPR